MNSVAIIPWLAEIEMAAYSPFRSIRVSYLPAR